MNRKESIGIQGRLDRFQKGVLDLTVLLRCLPLILISAVTAQAKVSEDADLCVSAADSAAEETGVPARLLRAITLVETQYAGGPWPWTVNINGNGDWHTNRSEAEAAVSAAMSSGETPDVGCFQISMRWHRDAFPSIEAMFEPQTNALYAARYLLHLHSQTGNWSDAVAAYHSRDPQRGAEYLARVGTVLAKEEAAESAAPQLRRNRFPLLVTGAPATPGSVVPRLSGTVPFIGAP